MNGFLITISYTVFAAAAVWVSVYVIRSTRGGRPREVDSEQLAHHDAEGDDPQVVRG
jgi:hypothetical protein